MDDKKLIGEIQNFPVLFDATHPHYKDNDKKDKSWAELSQEVGVDGEFV